MDILKKNKLHYCLFLILLFPFFCLSQSKIGNEWIKYDQDYLKISIDRKGIYRIGKNDLVNGGLNITGKNPKKIKVYFRGNELAINIIGENDNSFDENDYIEFFALNNDGKQDEEVYNPRSRPHPYYSLYTDETAYFLTFSNDNNFGKRMAQPRQFKSDLINEPYYISTILKPFNEQWNFEVGNGFPASELVHSYFEPNEALVSKAYRLDKEGSDKFFNETIFLDDYEINALDSNQIRLESMVFSRKSSSKIVRWQFGTENGKINLSSYNYRKINSNIFKQSNNSLDLKLEIESSDDSSIPQNDRFSIAYYMVIFPRKFIYKDNSEYKLLNNKQNQSKIRFENINYAITGYDITDLENQKILKFEADQSKSEVSINIDSTSNSKIIWLSKLPISPKSYELIKFRKVEPKNHDYIIITDKKLLQSANQFSNYRSTPNGGSFTPLIAYTKDIYNEYTYGERNPIALNRFLNDIRKTNTIKYLFLIGKGYSFPMGLKIRENLDLVPTIGYPASDNLISEGINEKKSGIPTGRISALTNEEVMNYLDKVKEFEIENKNISSNLWKKNVLHLSGGADLFQINQFKYLLNNLGSIIKNSSFGGNYSLLSKNTATQSVQNIDITNNVNNGVGLITFIGHSNASALDLNIGYASDETLNYKNKSLYPFLFFNGCSAAGIFVNSQPLTSDWISTKNKGAIGVLAQSYYSFIGSNEAYMTKFYSKLFSNNDYINKPIGDVIKAVGDEIISSNTNDPYLLTNIEQLILQGDPAIKLFNMTKPDFQTQDGQLFLTSTQKNKAVAEGDSIKLGIIISNHGLYDLNAKVNLNLKKTFNDGKSTNQAITIKAVAYQDTVFINIKKDLNLKFVSVLIDFDAKVDEMDETNNTGNIIFNWETLKSTLYYSTATLVDAVNPNLEVKLNGKLPENGMEVGLNPVLEISLIDGNSFGNKADKLEVSYKKICDTCPDLLQKLELGSISGDPNEILAQIYLKELKAGKYQFYIQGYDTKRNASGEVYTFNFKIIEDSTVNLRVYPNPVNLYALFEIETLTINTPLNANYTISISDLRGITVKTLSGDLKSGVNNVFWDRKDNKGNLLINGLYIYSLDINQNNMNTHKTGKLDVLN